MNILSQNERDALIKALTDAPDEILIDAVRQRKDWMSGIRSSFKEVQGFVGMRVVEAPAIKYSGGGEKPEVAIQTMAAVVCEVPAKPSPRTNKSPGEPSTTRIGSKAKTDIFNILKMGAQPRMDTFGEHLKLLWSRGEVCYDGKDFYCP